MSSAGPIVCAQVGGISSQGFITSLDLSTSIGALQRDALSELGFEIRDDGSLLFRVRFPGTATPIEIGASVEGLHAESGSRFKSFVVRFFIEDGRKIAQSFLAMCLFASLTALSSPNDNVETVNLNNSHGETVYVCTINGHVSGSIDDLFEDAVDDMAIEEGFSDSDRENAVRARQLCLKAAGFDPGPIDGIQGDNTDGAAHQFAHFHGGIVVNWNSRVFRRFLVEQAYGHHHRHRQSAMADD